MPIYEYSCEDHGITMDLIKWPPPQIGICASCGGSTKLIPSLPARTSARWGDGGNINGTFDPGLGVRYHNTMEKEKIMRQKGLVSLEDMPQHFIEDRMESDQAENAKIDAFTQRWHQATVETGGDKIKALEIAVPAHEALAS